MRDLAQANAPHNQRPWPSSLPARGVSAPQHQKRFVHRRRRWARLSDMDLDRGGAMSRSDFEEALSRAAAGEPLKDTGTVPFNVVLYEVAASAPGSDARADAI